MYFSGTLTGTYKCTNPTISTDFLWPPNRLFL